MIVAKAHEPGEHRSSIACRDLRKWLKKFGLPYHSPHKFRHGHAVYALSMAKDVAALKAVSQNLMRENLTVTDGVYGVLSERDVRRQIASLGRAANSGEGKGAEDLARLLRAAADKLGEIQGETGR